MDKKSIKSFKYDDLEKEVVENLNEKKYRAKQIYEWLYRKRVEKFEEMTNLSKELIAKLNENYYIDNGEPLDNFENVVNALMIINDPFRIKYWCKTYQYINMWDCR